MTTATRTLQPFFCYYGGKWRVATKYPAPRHRVIVEPFAGAAGYSLRHPERDVILYDVDPIICGVWDYLIRVSESEVASLPLHVEHVDDLDVPQEAKWLIGFWLNKGTSSPRKMPSKWMRAGQHVNSFWGEAVRERIASQIDAIRHWRIVNAPYDQAPDVGATWFIDPPYQGKCGRQYRFSDVDFPALGAWCQARRGQVIVCEQEGADWLPFRFLGVFKSTEGKHGGKTSREMIWTNGDST